MILAFSESFLPLKSQVTIFGSFAVVFVEVDFALRAFAVVFVEADFAFPAFAVVFDEVDFAFPAFAVVFDDFGFATLASERDDCVFEGRRLTPTSNRVVSWTADDFFLDSSFCFAIVLESLMVATA